MQVRWITKRQETVGRVDRVASRLSMQISTFIDLNQRSIYILSQYVIIITPAHVTITEQRCLGTRYPTYRCYSRVESRGTHMDAHSSVVSRHYSTGCTVIG